jgi:hypothetical protein
MVVAGVLLVGSSSGSFDPAGLAAAGAGKFGSRLLVKLAAIFTLVGLVPGVLIYVVSYQFVSRSIESWFDVKVEGALDAGLSTSAAPPSRYWPSDLASKTRNASGPACPTCPTRLARPHPGAYP